MNLVLLCHPRTLGSTSMPRYAQMIGEGMTARGHNVQYWTSDQAVFSKLPVKSRFLRKWLGYGDQFLLYPKELKRKAAEQSNDTVFIFADQALGMWVPCVANRAHVIHCHDFLALRSALNEVPENPTSWTGKQYQTLIRKGFSRGSNFVCVSRRTQEDLTRFLLHQPAISEVVYNGLNSNLKQYNTEESNSVLADTTPIPPEGFILHVGGNQWYKNRLGVLHLYKAYASGPGVIKPLWMVGQPPTESLQTFAATIPMPGKVVFLTGLTDAQVNACYSRANLLLFPSLEEGFGWPIAEAMACGCPILTTEERPMSEVGGNIAFYLKRQPSAHTDNFKEWIINGAAKMREILSREPADIESLKKAGIKSAVRFDTSKMLDALESIYTRVQNRHLNSL